MLQFRIVNHDRSKVTNLTLDIIDSDTKHFILIEIEILKYFKLRAM